MEILISILDFHVKLLSSTLVLRILINAADRLQMVKLYPVRYTVLYSHDYGSMQQNEVNVDRARSF